jgi:peptide/nickel transport system permease protein
MSGFLVRKFTSFVATLVGASLVVFLALEILPGDPALSILGIDADPGALAALRQHLGLDRPAGVRYLAWVAGLATGDFGTSYTYGIPVTEILAPRLAVTIPLALMAMALSLAMALGIGLYAAANHGRPGAYGAMIVSQLGIAIPNFWLGLLLVLLFAVSLGWFPAGGFPGWSDGIGPAFKSLMLPAVALATVQGAILARVVRAALLEESGADFVRTARAKGLSRRRALLGHVLRNALVPIVTIMGLQFSFLLAGTIVVENVFSLPGLGRLVFQAISNRDLVVVKNVVMLLATMVIVVNFAVDLAYRILDPRLETAL